MGTSCTDSAQSLYECMKKTKCMENGGKLLDCLKDPVASSSCKELHNAYFTCKRSAYDMRTRLRGPRVH